MFFESWSGLLRVLIVGGLAYIALVVLLRVSGKRTLSKLNAFDLVVTVALGSTLATVLLSRDVALAEGVLAFGVLIFAQYAIAWLSVRSSAVRSLVKSEPRLLAWHGRVLPEALRDERVTEAELSAVIRGEGYGALKDTRAVILETDGSFHVLPADGGGDTALESVRGYEGA